MVDGAVGRVVARFGERPAFFRRGLSDTGAALVGRLRPCRSDRDGRRNRRFHAARIEQRAIQLRDRECERIEGDRAPSLLKRGSYLIASGFVGEPTAPVMGSAGATNMNSYTPSAAQSSASSFT